MRLIIIFLSYIFLSFRVGIISDSNGHDWPDRKSFSTYLEDISGFEIINDSIDGSCSILGPERMRKMVETYHPDIFIIELGINDLSWGIDPQVRRYCGWCYSLLKEKYKIPVLISRVDYLTYENEKYFPPGRRWGKSAQKHKEYLTKLEYTNIQIKDMGLKFFPFLTKDIIENYTIKNENDYIHLTDDGAKIVAQRLYEKILQIKDE